jgi:hypothetical protein
MMARVGETRLASLKPARAKALTVPWYAKASGQRVLGSFG